MSTLKYSSHYGKMNGALFLFYLALIANYTMDRVLPPELIEFFDKSRAGKHIVAFLILLFTINLYAPKFAFGKVFLYTFGIWVWFLFTSKQHLWTSFIILALLLVSYVAFNIEQDQETPKDEKEGSKGDGNVTIHRPSNYLQQIQKGCFITIFIISIIGGAIYFKDHYRRFREADGSFGTFLWRYISLSRT
jgi:hypothetical protein